MAADYIRERANPRKKIPSRKAKKAIDVEKIAKLLRLCGSSHDGEVIASVVALRRTLGAAGLDLHDLANAVTEGFKPKSPPPTRWTPTEPDRQSWEALAWYAHYHRRYLMSVDADYVAGVLVGQHFDLGRATPELMRRLRSIVDRIEAARSVEDRW